MRDRLDAIWAELSAVGAVVNRDRAQGLDERQLAALLAAERERLQALTSTFRPSGA